jgi:hypothetical protein
VKTLPQQFDPTPFLLHTSTPKYTQQVPFKLPVKSEQK